MDDDTLTKTIQLLQKHGLHQKPDTHSKSNSSTTPAETEDTDATPFVNSLQKSYKVLERILETNPFIKKMQVNHTPEKTMQLFQDYGLLQKSNSHIKANCAITAATTGYANTISLTDLPQQSCTVLQQLLFQVKTATTILSGLQNLDT